MEDRIGKMPISIQLVIYLLVGFVPMLLLSDDQSPSTSVFNSSSQSASADFFHEGALGNVSLVDGTIMQPLEVKYCQRFSSCVIIPYFRKMPVH